LLEKLIAEVTDAEFKSALEKKKPKSWLKSVSAFANSKGGTIFLGVDDGTHSVVGVKDVQGDIDFVSEAIKEKLDPSPDVNISAIDEGGKHVIVCEVPAGNQTPYYYKADGEYRAYTRTGSESNPASTYQLKELVLKGSKLSFDSLETNHELSKYSFDSLKATYYERLHIPFEDTDFVSFGLATEDGKLTNAGVLLADQWILRQNRIFCTRWNGQSKAHQKQDVLDDHEYEGSLIWLLRNGLAFIEQHNTIKWRKTDANRIEEPSFAPRACEETLVNALIHRDFMFPGSEVTIFIFDDRLEITSPGSKIDGRLPEDVDVYNVSSARRNPILADLFQRMGFMERRGSGLRKIREETAWCANYRDEFKPLFKDDGHNFTVTLWDMNYQPDSASGKDTGKDTGMDTGKDSGMDTDKTTLILNIIGSKEMSAQEIMDNLGLSHRQHFLDNYLTPALESGRVERTLPDKPSSKNQKYRRA
jgi:ATP-dependent DNA helicase RecG